MRLARAALLFCLLATCPALADAPATSLRPEPRPGVGLHPEVPEDRVTTPAGPVVVTVRATRLAPSASLRPVLRPGIGQQMTPIREEEEPLPPDLPDTLPSRPPQGLIALLGGPSRRNPSGVTAVAFSLRPLQRPDAIVREARASANRATPGRVTQPGRRGALCGQRGIVGDVLEPIPGRINGCGISQPVRVREIDGVPLTQPATINCDTALALREWLNDTVIPEVGRRGGGVNSIRVIASYSCRTRNNQPGARLSEHATGNAVDVAAIGLVDGTEISVLDDWGSGAEGRILRNLHSGACGTFGTVLGPNSDRYHRNHFHLDVASYRGGAYCR